MAIVGENRALRDQYNVLRRQLVSLQEQYNRDRPSIGNDYNNDVTVFGNLVTQTNQILVQMAAIRTQNSQNPDLFDPTLNQRIEENTSDGQELIRNAQGVVDIAKQAQRNITEKQAQDARGPETTSAGEQASEADQARADGAQTQAPPVQQSPAPGVTNAEPAPTDAPPPAQAAPPGAGAPAAQPPGSGVETSALPAQQPQVQLPEPQVRQTYYYKAISVTSTFSGGRFTQDLEGALLITPVRRVLPVTTLGGGVDAAVGDTGQFESQAGGVTGLVPPAGFDAASLGAGSTRSTDLPTNVGNLVPVPAGVPSVSQIVSAVPRLPGDPGVLAPALRNLPTSGGAQIGLFNNTINTTISAGISSGTPDADLTYTGNDGIVWDRINAERLRRGLPGLAAIGSPRPPDDRASTQTTTYQTQRET